MMRLVDFILILPIVISVDSARDVLKCYQCESDSCTDKSLDVCPDDQAYDRCMTRMSKTKAEGYLFRKGCALAPCSLRDQSANEGLGLDDCDTSKDEYDCISCCKTDGCNMSGASIYWQEKTLMSISAVLFGVFSKTLTT